ncbi:uncharacterized protein [Apostichopus japonicus]|uniref:uncharacterized protein n=1 Tax=Stichopus japonicus TaxID=307972 RepID=UPI003AB2FC25
MSRVVVLEALRNSRRGQLKYDATWHTDGHLQDIIQITSSPPPLSPELITHSLQKLQLSADQNELKNSFTDHSSPEESDNEENESHRDCKVLDTVGSKSSYNDDLNCALDKNAAKIQVALHLHEVEITREAKDRVEVRKKQHAEFSQQLEQDARQNISLVQQRMELRQRAHWQKINDVNTESEENRERRLLHQQERHRLHLKKLDAKMKAALQQKELAEMEKQKRKQAELKSFLDSLVKVRGQIDEQATRMIEALEACPHQEQLAPKGNEIKAVIKRLQAKSDQVVVNAQGSKPSEEPFHVMTVLIQKLMDINNLSSHAIAEAEKAGLLAAEERKVLAAKAKEEATKAAAAAATKSSVLMASSLGSSSIAANSSNIKGVLNESAQPDSLQEYNKLQENLGNVRKAFLELKQSKNKELKKYCFDIQKAINTPINAISSQSGSHFMDKLRRLQQLLDGQSVEAGSKMVSAATHPAGMAFCKDLLAKKLVKQGHEQVSSNYESAFPFATLAVGLWCKYPDVGDLILANFHQQCPFLVPYHISKQENQSNEEYYKLLGYQYDSEGVIEKQDKYLKRMSGFTRLYAAILVSSPPPGCGQISPFGRERAWQWLSRLLNLEPQPDITATMLFDFLEVCGFALIETYNKQFLKLLEVLIHGYFPKIEAVTPKGSGGPVMRLKSYLQNCLGSHKFPPPAGLLSSSFWRTY